MATADYTQTFSGSALGIVRVGSSTNITFAYDGTDGNPAGCIKFTEAAFHTATEVEKARQTGTSQTWESLFGIVANSTVLTAEAVSADGRDFAGTGLSAFKMRIVTPAGVTTHSAGDLFSGAMAGNVWVAFPANRFLGPVSIDPAYQASATAIAVEYECTCATQTTTMDARLDNVLYRITYLAGTGGGGTGGSSGTLVQPAPNGGVWLADGTFIPGPQVCGAGVADIYTLLGEIRQGYQ